MIMMTMMTIMIMSMTSEQIDESLNYLLLQMEKGVLVLTLRKITTFNQDKTNSKTCILLSSGLASESLLLMLLKLL